MFIVFIDEVVCQFGTVGSSVFIERPGSFDFLSYNRQLTVVTVCLA